MKYGVWFFRLVFAAWMIPAGLNHFFPIFPQPMGSEPLSQELIIALIDSHLFDLVKLVELIVGLGLLFGFYVPLMLLICLPVSFCVFYWDAPLEGWISRPAAFGYSILLCNALLCLFYAKHYRSMLAVSVPVGKMKQLVRVGRMLFGIWMLLNGANYLFLSLWSMPTGQEPLAIQLMTSLTNSRLLDVAMVIQLVAGALILIGIFVPVSLYALMPISTCALFWALILNHQPLYALLALAAFAINGLLMLAYLHSYRGVLQRRTLAVGEVVGEGASYDALFVNPNGHISRAKFLPALVVVVAAMAFFDFLVPSVVALFCMLVLLYPASVLLARRLKSMGYSVWLVCIPLALMLLHFSKQLGYISLGDAFNMAIPWIALVAFMVFALWGCVSRRRI